MRITIICTLILLLGSCGGGDAKRRAESLDEAVNHYGQALRWGRYEDAETYHMARGGERTRFDLAVLENVRITEYIVRNRELNADLTEVEVDGEISYFNRDYAALRRVPFKHKWWYEPESKRWFLDGSLPEFK